MEDGDSGSVEVVVRRVVSSLETNGGHGWGEGVLVRDGHVHVTFLLLQPEFRRLRQRILGGQHEVAFRVRLEDVTAVRAVRNGDRPGPGGSFGADL